MKVLETTLCLLFKDNKILLAKKKRGFGEGKYNGVGGKIEDGESVEQAMIRETQEEINITPISFDKVGIISFDEYYKGEQQNVVLHLYFVNEWDGEPKESIEMKPEWFDISNIPYDKMFPDDKYWLPLVLKGQKIRAYFEFDKEWNLLSKKIEDLNKNITVVIDGQAGSCGKGKICGYLAKHDNFEISTNSWASNSGHTFVDKNDNKIIVSHLPMALVNKNTKLFINAGAIITPEILFDEIDKYKDLIAGRKIYIHPRAMISMQKYKVAGYVRLSKNEIRNDESSSITNQKQIIDDYLEEHKEYKLVDYYVDDGYSGKNFNRPEFQRMLKDIKNKEINVIIVKDLSRFGRNHIEVDNYLEVIFPAMKVSVISITENCEINSSSYYGNDYVPLKSLLNDMYAKDISKKVRSSLIVKKNNGEFVGKLAPYGYIKDPKDKHKFLIDKNVSKIIVKIFDMILKGKSRKEIADYLNQKEILTPSEYLKINTDKNIKTMKKWNSEMVNNILRNENYTGTLLQGKKRKLNYRVNKEIKVNKEDWIVTENHHEAIINKEKFDEVQDILNKKVKINKNGTIDIFAGFLKCKQCGNIMTTKKAKNKIYYYCSEYYRKKNCENINSIEQVILINLIKNKLNINELTRLKL